MNRDGLKAYPALLMQTATYWQAPWLLQAMAQQGRSHYNEGCLIEDAHIMRPVGDSLLLAVADGMSSAARGGEGALSAVSVVGHALTGIAHPDAADLKNAVGAAHAALIATTPDAPHALATTLAAVRISDKAVHAISIGDSNIVSITEDGAGALKLAPFCVGNQPSQDGTVSLTDPQWERHAGSVTSHPDLLTGLILATDGAQPFFYKDMGLSGRSALDATVVQGLPAAISKLTARSLSAYFSLLMTRPEYMSLDDRTLLMAFKPSEKESPPKPKTKVMAHA